MLRVRAARSDVEAHRARVCIPPCSEASRDTVSTRGEDQWRSFVGRAPITKDVANPGTLLALQRSAGNAAVRSLVGAPRAARMPVHRDVRYGSAYVSGRLFAQRERDPTPQRADGGTSFVCRPRMDSRCIPDELHLRSAFWGDDAQPGSRIDAAFHNNPPLTAADNAEGGPVAKLQSALMVVGEDLGPKGADGSWGGRTTGAVVSFQSKNGVQPGGFEAGRKTLLALDDRLQSVVPDQPRVPVVHVTPDCGAEQTKAPSQSQYTIRVTGDDFTKRAAAMVTFGASEEFRVQPDDTGHFVATIRVARRSAGTYTVRAFDFSGGKQEEARTSFTVPCPVNPSDPSQLNPALEAVLDQIPIAYERMMFNKLTGLTNLERDLSDEPEQVTNLGTLGWAAVKFAVERSIEFVFNAQLTRVLAVITHELHDEQPDLIKHPIINTMDIFSELQNIALDAEKKYFSVDDLPIGKSDPEALLKEMRKFVDGQRQTLLSDIEKLQEEFVARKPDLRELPSPPTSPTDDPRVTAAKAYLKGVEQTATTAETDQYQESIKQWSAKKAQAEFGQTKDKFGQPAGTDLSKGAEAAPLFSQEPGLFKIRVRAGAPSNLTPDVARIAVNGLTKGVRESMTTQDIRLRDLGPRRVLAVTAAPVTHVLVSKNETGEVFVNSTHSDPTQWLIAHHQAVTPGTSPTVKGGAIALFDEIENGPQDSLKKIPGGLQTGGFFL